MSIASTRIVSKVGHRWRVIDISIIKRVAVLMQDHLLVQGHCHGVLLLLHLGIVVVLSELRLGCQALG